MNMYHFISGILLLIFGFCFLIFIVGFIWLKLRLKRRNKLYQDMDIGSLYPTVMVLSDMGGPEIEQPEEPKRSIRRK